jgi:sugar O-acyltransferase (sialic acid O-acetyltransferase NeuD family)
MTKKIVVFGANNSALSMLFEILESLPVINKDLEIIMNQPRKDFSPFQVSSIKTKEINIDNWLPGTTDQYLLGVYNPESKKNVFNLYSSRFGIDEANYISLVHPFSSIASTSTWGNGVIMNPGSILAPYCKIGSFVSINRKVTIGHHSQIGDYATINPGTNIGGHCVIGENVLIGMGSNIFDGIEIGKNSVIGGGALVTKNVPENVLVYGSPAKIIREL